MAGRTTTLVETMKIVAGVERCKLGTVGAVRCWCTYRTYTRRGLTAVAVRLGSF